MLKIVHQIVSSIDLIEFVCFLVVFPENFGEKDFLEFAHFRDVLSIEAVHDELSGLLNWMVEATAMVQPSEFVSLLHELLDLRSLPVPPLKSSKNKERSLLCLDHRIEIRQLPQLDSIFRHLVRPTTSRFRFLLFPAIRRHRKRHSVTNIRNQVHRIRWRCPIECSCNDVLVGHRMFAVVNQYRWPERNERPTHRRWIQRARIEVLNRQSEHLLELIFCWFLTTRDDFFVNFLNSSILRKYIHQHSFLIRKRTTTSSCRMKHEFPQDSLVFVSILRTFI